MNIAEAKQQIKDTIEAYFACDEDGCRYIAPSQQRPIFLLGAPGIGKTAIMEQIADELDIGLVAYSMTHHTRQSALGLPFIVHEEFNGLEYDASEYTMSEIIASIYDYMRTSDADHGILFLDEINCVSETLYPSMLQFLQMKTFGRHAVPDGWIVVCAGNPPEYNKSVHEFDIVTLDRLRKMEVEPDYEAWKAYAQTVGIHPAILTFLEVKKEFFYLVETRPGEKTFVTARGWNDLSKVMTLFEKLDKPVDLSLIEQFLQNDEAAEAFSQYYALFSKYRSDYQIDHILAGEAPADIVARASEAPFDERVALLGLLLDALGAEMGNALDEEKVLVDVRDVLRASKEELNGGAGLDSTVEAALAAKEERLERVRKTHPGSSTRIRQATRANKLLKELISDARSNGCVQGPQALQALTGPFQERTALLPQRVASIEEELANTFAFLEAAFADGEREMLLFMTDLTARSDSSQFISRFGSSSYYAHNEGLLVDRNKHDLLQRIDDFGDIEAAADEAAAASAPGVAIQGKRAHIERVNERREGVSLEQVSAVEKREPAASTQAAPEPEPSDIAPAVAIDEEELASYYAGAQFEYGLPSLCRMTLPSDLAGKTVLDIGCRRGRGVYKLSDRVGESGHVIGVDWNKAYIDEASAGQDRAWHDTGLRENNMEFHLAYPENLAAAGIADNSVDFVFINNVSNIVYDMDALYAEIHRVLRPGGVFFNETVLANEKRDAQVVEAACKVGNSVQAAPEKTAYESMLARAGFSSVSYSHEEVVYPNTGALPQIPADTVESTEDVSFTALVATCVK